MSRKLRVCFALAIASLVFSDSAVAIPTEYGGSKGHKKSGSQSHIGGSPNFKGLSNFTNFGGFPNGGPKIGGPHLSLSELEQCIPFKIPDGLANILSPTATPTSMPAQKGIPQPTTATQASATASPSTNPSNGKNVCKSFTADFSSARIVEAQNYNNDPSSADWINLSGTPQTYSVSGGILNMNLLPPQQYEPTETDQGKYNKELGLGLTLNSTYMIQYGTISAKIKTCPLGGVVTAFITMSPNGDEIDWEYVGGDETHVQSNYYWNGLIEWGVHGGVHNVSAPPICDAFHEYSINWTPDAITWAVDGTAVRTLLANSTYTNGTYEFPSHPSHVQFGIWDGSGAPGTANWSNGPIDWSQQTSNPSSQISEVTITCDPDYNDVI